MSKVKLHTYRDTAVSNSLVDVRSDSVELLGVRVYNPDGADDAYLQFFNDVKASVTLGTTTPIDEIVVPSGAGVVIEPGALGIEMVKGLSMAATKSAGASDAPTSDLHVVLYVSTVS